MGPQGSPRDSLNSPRHLSTSQRLISHPEIGGFETYSRNMPGAQAKLENPAVSVRSLRKRTGIPKSIFYALIAAERTVAKDTLKDTRPSTISRLTSSTTPHGIKLQEQGAKPPGYIGVVHPRRFSDLIYCAFIMLHIVAYGEMANTVWRSKSRNPLMYITDLGTKIK